MPDVSPTTQSVDARQFDGTLGSAKAVTAWCGEGKAVFGATWGYTDDMEGGLNLVTEVGGAPFYTTVNASDWVVKSESGELQVFADAQFRLAFTVA